MAEMNVTSLRLDSDTRRWLERYGGPLGAQIREDLLILEQAVRLAERNLTGRFSVAEACAICDALNSFMFDPRLYLSGPTILAAEIGDGAALDGLDEKWGFERTALVEKLNGLTSLEAYVVIHLARIFWSGLHERGDIKTTVAKLFRCE